MRNTIFALMLAAAVLLPSTVFAGQGGTKFYGVHFNDSDNDDAVYNFATWISVSNPNTYNAVVNVTYYKNDGTLYSDPGSNTTFTRVIAPNTKMAWRPVYDIQPVDAKEFKGSYVLEVTEGSVVSSAGISLLAGVTHPELGIRYSLNDVVAAVTTPLHTLTSTHLSFDAFIQSDDGDNMALTDGEWVTWMTINNPSDTVTADLTMTVYDQYGTVLTAQNIALGPHCKLGKTLGDYGIGLTGQVKGNIVIDVTKGSVIANYSKLSAKMNISSITYGGNGGSFQKNLIVQ